MAHDSNISGQAHHLSQDATFRDVIPTNDGLCVELEGNAFVDIGSGHYETHKSMEAFWNQYRKGGDLYGEIPIIDTYNRALYNSLKAGGLNNKNVAYAVRSAYDQQMSHGLSNIDLVPRIPGRINQRK